MNGSGILLLVVGLVAGVVILQAMRPAQPAPAPAPAAAKKGWADVVIAGLPIGKDLFDEFW